MLRREDRITTVSLRLLRLAVMRGAWLRAESGVSIRVKEVLGGYELRVKAGISKVPVIIRVDVKDVDINHAGRTTRCLRCAKCGKFTHRHLFIDWDLVALVCSACTGVKGGLKGWLHTPAYEYEDLARFKRLLRQKMMYDIWAFEYEVVRALTAEELFASRPYLVPEFVYAVREADAVLYRKLLVALHGRYKLVIRNHKPPRLRQRDEQWVEAQLKERLTSGRYYISDKENIWKNPGRLFKRRAKGGGRRRGIRPDLRSLQPSEIDSLLSKMNSGQAMNAAVVRGRDESSASNAKEQESMSEVLESLSVLPAMEKES